MPKKIITPDQWAEAENLLTPEADGGGGLSFTQVAEQTGITRVSLYRHFPQFKRNPDPTPGGKQAGKTGKRGKSGKSPFVSRVTDEQLIPFYSKAASAPAIPMMLYVNCEFCAQHFTDTGPDVAEKLVAMSADNPHLRQVMELGYRSLTQAAWASVLLMYVGVPVAHHMAPENVQGMLRMFGILPMEHTTHTHAREHAHSTNGNGATPKNPYSDMDLSDLLAEAERAGIKLEDIEPDVIRVEAEDVVIEDATTTESAEDITIESSEPGPEPVVEADESDSLGIE